jgi:prevent-host-death family protein
MNTMTTVKAREHFSEFVNRTAYGKERVILTRRGKSIAVLVPLEDLKLLETAEDLLDVQDAQAALKEIEKHSAASLEKFKSELKRL